MKIILTGGGTGGHIYPALSVGLKMKSKGNKLLYIGSRGGLEEKIVPDKEIELETIEVAPLPRKITPLLLKSIFKSTRGFFQARKLIKEFKPDIVLGTGGFVAGPVVLAASLAGIPTLIHEQNVYPGLTNKLLSFAVDKIALNFAEAVKYIPRNARKKCVVTGNPIREAILKISRKKGLMKLNLQTNRDTLLVFGGSQGSRSINEAMYEVCKTFSQSSSIQIIYITGESNYDNIVTEFKNRGIDLTNSKHIKIIPYLHNMEWAYVVADLIVYRAGATGLAEITASGIPAILIPYPYATGNHQEYNAKNMERHGAAVVIQDKKLTGKVLVNKINQLLADKERLVKMKNNSKELGQPDALNKLVKELEKMV